MRFTVPQDATPEQRLKSVFMTVLQERPYEAVGISDVARHNMPPAIIAAAKSVGAFDEHILNMTQERASKFVAGGNRDDCVYLMAKQTTEHPDIREKVASLLAKMGDIRFLEFSPSASVAEPGAPQKSSQLGG
jgi:hypothetical protein